MRHEASVRRAANWFSVVLSIGMLIAVLLLSGCGGSGESVVGQNPADTSGLLRLVRSPAEFEASLKAGVREVSAVGDPTAAVSPGSFSGTYTLDINVDEFDAVRYDGRRLYVAPQRTVTCCWALPAAAGGDVRPPPSSRSVRILETDPNNATARVVGAIALPERTSIQGMYTRGDQLIALTSEVFYGGFGSPWLAVPVWAPQKFGLQFYDVRDAANPRAGFSATFDGVFVDSRRIGDFVYLVSRHSPTALLDPAARAAIDSVPLGDLLPKVIVNGITRPLVDPSRCYVTNDTNDSGYAVITSITIVPIDNPASFTTTCYNEDAYGVYMSEQALYLTQIRPTPTGRNETTRVHKFALTGASVAYRGSAEVAGVVWRGGQADFRINEHQGLLRMMTTQLTSDASDSFSHQLIVLRQSATALALEVAAQLPNERRPERIGKPNESLFGVRFFGERAYAVTFLRVDPLYAIDLATPTDPRIAGALEVPGFSELLHPVSEGLLLGVGLFDTGGIKVELFDVSNLAVPQSRGSVRLGGRGSHSEALYDRHAFAYLPGATLDRFALPANLFSEDGQYRFVSAGLHLFEIANKLQPSQAVLRTAGRVVPQTGSSQGVIAPAARNRAYLHDDAVFYVRDEDVWAARWSAPGTLNGPY
jgi:uncharacterized secreted protein with C-terminal beta-propeller domain